MTPHCWRTCCVSSRKHYTGTPCRPEVVAVAALYHDAPEIITGDMPTPVKYHIPSAAGRLQGAGDRERALPWQGFCPPELAAGADPLHGRQRPDGRGAPTAQSCRPARVPSSNAPRSSAAATTNLTPHSRQQHAALQGHAMPGGRLVSGALPALLSPRIWTS